MSTAGKPVLGPSWPALQAFQKQLEEAVVARQVSSFEGIALEPLDRAVCLAARGLFVRYVDVAGWCDRPDPALTEFCMQQLLKAQKCISLNSYPGAQAFLEPICEKVRLLSQIVAGSSIEAVLAEAVSSS